MTLDDAIAYARLLEQAGVLDHHPGGGGLGPIADAELAEDARDMHGDRSLADVQGPQDPRRRSARVDRRREVVLAGTPSLDIHQAPAKGNSAFAVLGKTDAEFAISLAFEDVKKMQRLPK